MGKCYKYLTEQDRVFLSVLLGQGHTKDKIAKILGVDRSTIYREIKRNVYIPNYSEEKLYHSWYAQKSYMERRRRRIKIVNDQLVRHQIESKLLLGWSPWQMRGD